MRLLSAVPEASTALHGSRDYPEETSLAGAAFFVLQTVLPLLGPSDGFRDPERDPEGIELPVIRLADVPHELQLLQVWCP